MDNFEETVVNPNIHIRNVDRHVHKVSNKPEPTENVVNEPSSSDKPVNTYFLFAAIALIVALVAMLARV